MAWLSARNVTRRVPPGAELLGNTFPADDRKAGVPFTFAFYSDPQSNDYGHSRVCDAIIAWKPSFTLCGGDFAHDPNDKEQWKGFLESSWKLRRSMPWLPVRGNHDHSDSIWTDLDWPGGRGWYSFDFRHAHFTVIDMEEPRLDADTPQGAWLIRDLEAAATRPLTFAFVHPSVVSSGRYFAAGHLRPLEFLHPIFKRTGVDLVFSGHEHFYERLKYEGMTYVVAAGGGGFIRQPARTHESRLVLVRKHHYCLVSVHPSHAAVMAIGLDGSIIDQFAVFPR